MDNGHIPIAILKELKKISKLLREQAAREALRTASTARVLGDVVKHSGSSRGGK